MKLEVGKKYVNRNGAVVKITHEGNFKDFPFVGNAGRSYTEYGRAMLSEETIFDLIAEYEPAEPERWIYSDTVEGKLAIIQECFPACPLIEYLYEGKWDVYHEIETIDVPGLLDGMEKKVLRIKNPRYTEPKKPEVGDLYSHKNDTDFSRKSMYLGVDENGKQYHLNGNDMLLYPVNYPEDWIFTGQRVDLSALEADDD